MFVLTVRITESHVVSSLFHRFKDKSILQQLSTACHVLPITSQKIWQRELSDHFFFFTPHAILCLKNTSFSLFSLLLLLFSRRARNFFSPGHSTLDHLDVRNLKFLIVQPFKVVKGSLFVDDIQVAIACCHGECSSTERYDVTAIGRGSWEAWRVSPVTRKWMTILSGVWDQYLSALSSLSQWLVGGEKIWC